MNFNVAEELYFFYQTENPTQEQVLAFIKKLMNCGKKIEKFYLIDFFSKIPQAYLKDHEFLKNICKINYNLYFDFIMSDDNFEFFKANLLCNAFFIQHAKKEWLTPEICSLSLDAPYKAELAPILRHTPVEIRSYELCLKAVILDGRNLQEVPEHLRDYNMCLNAIKSYGDALHFVPEKLRTLEISLISVTEDFNNESYKHVNIVPNPDLKTTLINLNKLLVKSTIGSIQ